MKRAVREGRSLFTLAWHLGTLDRSAGERLFAHKCRGGVLPLSAMRNE